MTISFTSLTAIPNAYATSAKHQSAQVRSNTVPNRLNDSTALRFASRDRFKSGDSSDDFDIPLAYARHFKAREDPDYEEKATVLLLVPHRQILHR